MTPDDAIALTKNYKNTFHFYTTWKDAACVLAGEVERLRIDVQRLVDANEEYHGDALALEQERDELRRRVADLKSSLIAASNYIDVLGGVSKTYRYQANQIEGGE